MKRAVLRNVGGVALMATLLAFAHPVASEGLRVGQGLERRSTPADLREDLRGERREAHREDLREHQVVDAGRRTGRLDARFDAEPGAGVRRLNAEERRQLRRELQDAARELYSR